MIVYRYISQQILTLVFLLQANLAINPTALLPGAAPQVWGAKPVSPELACPSMEPGWSIDVDGQPAPPGHGEAGVSFDLPAQADTLHSANKVTRPSGQALLSAEQPTCLSLVHELHMIVLLQHPCPSFLQHLPPTAPQLPVFPLLFRPIYILHSSRAEVPLPQLVSAACGCSLPRGRAELRAEHTVQFLAGRESLVRPASAWMTVTPGPTACPAAARRLGLLVSRPHSGLPHLWPCPPILCLRLPTPRSGHFPPQHRELSH